MNIQDPCTICQGVETQRKEQYHTDKGKKSPLNGRCFRKTFIEKAYVVVTYSVSISC